MIDFWRGVAVTIVGGILLFLIVEAIESYLDSRLDLRWTTSDEFMDLPEARFEGRYPSSYHISMQNFGNSSADNIEVIFRGCPASVGMKPPLPFVLEDVEPWRCVLSIDSLAPGEELQVTVDNAAIDDLQLVSVSDRQIGRSKVYDSGFDLGPRVPIWSLLLLGSGWILLGVGSAFLIGSQRRLPLRTLKYDDLKKPLVSNRDDT